MSQEPSQQVKRSLVWEPSFREAAELLHEGATELERCLALRALSADPSRQSAAWEAVRSFLAREGSHGMHQGALDSPEVCRLAAQALARGAESQMAELHEAVRMATMPLFPAVRVMAEAVTGKIDLRVGWFRDLVGDEPMDRLRAAEVLTCAPPGSLSNLEGMAVARYLFSQCSEDHLAMAGDGKGSLALPYSDGAERISVFFARHANEGALAIAELVMERMHILSYVGLKMLVKHGDQRCRDAAFEHSIKFDRLSVVGVEGWPAEAIKSVEGRLVTTLTSGETCANVLVSCIQALKKIRSSGNHEEAMFPLVKRERWNGELARAVAGYVTAGAVSSGAALHARQTIEPPRDGIPARLGLKLPSGYFLAARPSLGQVQLAAAILEASHDPFRRELYRSALNARDISGRWLVGASRVVVASHLPPMSVEATQEILRASRADLEVAVRYHQAALLDFAGRTSQAAAFRIIDQVMSMSQLDAGPVARTAEVVESLWVRAAGDESARAKIASHVVSLAERFGGGLVRMDLCARFYDSLARIPAASCEDFVARLAKVAGEVQRSPMVVPSTELKALASLIERTNTASRS